MPALLPLATLEQLAEYLGESITEESAEAKQAVWCLRGASVLVRDEAGNPRLGADGDEIPEAALTATLACAARGYTNPRAQMSGGIDDAQERWRVEEAGLYLTASEERSLRSLHTKVSGIGTIGTYRGRPRSRPNTVPTDTEGVEIPWW